MTTTAAVSSTPASSRLSPVLWAIGRVLVGWVFLWTFVDKLVGTGFSTDRGWLDGASPTEGFLTHGVSNAVGRFYADVTGGGGGWIDWVYMLSMLAIGLGLILGALTRIAAVGGIVWLVCFYTASYSPENNPIVDQHVAYIALLVGVIVSGAGRAYGVGRVIEARWRGRRLPFWLTG